MFKDNTVEAIFNEMILDIDKYCTDLLQGLADQPEDPNMSLFMRQHVIQQTRVELKMKALCECTKLDAEVTTEYIRAAREAALN